MPTPTLERRTLAAAELRARKSGDKHSIEGYAAKFGSYSHDLGGFRETIMPGAFEQTLRTADVRMLINHEPSKILGRVKAGTLRVWTDSAGLRFDCSLPDTVYARDLYKSIERGDISQCSFAFRADDEDWPGSQKFDDDGDGIAETVSSIRALKRVTLFDVSAVAFPAYESTEVSARAIDYARSHPVAIPHRRDTPAEILRANLSINYYRAEEEQRRITRRRRMEQEITS